MVLCLTMVWPRYWKHLKLIFEINEDISKAKFKISPLKHSFLSDLLKIIAFRISANMHENVFWFLLPVCKNLTETDIHHRLFSQTCPWNFQLHIVFYKNSKVSRCLFFRQENPAVENRSAKVASYPWNIFPNFIIVRILLYSKLHYTHTLLL